MYYNPSVIVNKLEQELRLNYDDIVHYVATARVRVNEKKIKSYLDKRFQNENSELKEKVDKIELSNNKTSGQISAKGINELISYKYYFEPYTLEYFKKTVRIYKKKCNNIIKIINGIIDGNIPREILQELDIKVSKNGNIIMSDILRLTEPLVYNFNRLKETVQRANKLETYYEYKLSLDSIRNNESNVEVIYPSEELQNIHYEFEGERGFVPYTKQQKLLLKKQEETIVSSICDVYKNLK